MPYEAPTVLPRSMNTDLDTQLNFTMIALSDPTRRAILEQLARGEACVTDVAQPFEISLNAVSKHLKILERAGLIRREITWPQPRALFRGEAARRGCGMDRDDE